MTTQHNLVFTIGHSTHRLDAFIKLLKRHGVTVLADVRSAPFSRFNPQFNKDSLQRDLKLHGIKYVFLGRELGARSNDSSCYEDGRVLYARLARTDLFRHGVARVMRGAEDHRIALMCAEREPLECHRTLLVATALDEQGVKVAHILADGGLEAHSDSMERLLDLTGLPREDLFSSQAELIKQALARQGQKVAYVDEKLAAEASGNSQ
jgi:uncharacterized protein (DUF488 family)